MTDTLISEAARLNIRLAVIPPDCLGTLKNDLNTLTARNTLNAYQNWIVGERYVLEPPQTAFQIRSLVIAVRPLNVAKAIFQYGGKTASCIMEDSLINADTHRQLSALFTKHGYALKPVDWMPDKLLAVRSGLCEYGRNNITYCGDWGSYIHITALVSDLPPDSFAWREMKNMDICGGCEKCIRNCPTGAIMPDRFLIDNEKCLSCYNLSDTIPDWIPASAHNALAECSRCQNICPMNQKRLSELETVTFSEDETEAILNSASFQDFPEPVRKKLRFYDNGEPYTCLPRNLRLLLENV